MGIRPAPVSIVGSRPIGRSVREGTGELDQIPMANDENGAPLLRRQEPGVNRLTQVCQIRTTSFRFGLH